MLTRHAQARAVQRSVPKLAIDLVLDFGVRTRSGGADKVTLDKAGRKAIAREIGPRAYEALRPLLDVYLVVADSGEIITVAHRLQRAFH